MAKKTVNTMASESITLSSAADKNKSMTGVKCLTIIIFAMPKTIRPYRQTLLLIWKG